MKWTVFFKFSIFLLLLNLVSCQEEDYFPKAKAKLALNYPKANYKTIKLDNCPYDFKINTLAEVRRKKDCNITLIYPNIDLAIDLTYISINNDIKKAVAGVNKIATEHIKRGDGFLQHPFENETNIGMVIEVKGNVASNAQFYVTDKKKHFLSGSLYFKSRPQIDSLLPAVHYLNNDIKVIMETVKWK
jgi:gliding motility-associated lipoprotein GldD